jgi:hypothetical protein
MSTALTPLPLVETNPQVMQAFCNDVAQGIHEYATIAARYYFADTQAVLDYLKTKAAVRKRIKALRAVWQSDDNVEIRVRTLAGHSLLEALPSTSRVMFNEELNPSVRIDAMKAHARIAGLDSPPPAQAGGGAVGGNRFSVQIVFSQAGTVETIKSADLPPVIEGEAV